MVIDTSCGICVGNPFVSISSRLLSGYMLQSGAFALDSNMIQSIIDGVAVRSVNQ